MNKVTISLISALLYLALATPVNFLLIHTHDTKAFYYIFPFDFALSLMVSFGVITWARVNEGKQ